MCLFFCFFSLSRKNVELLIGTSPGTVHSAESQFIEGRMPDQATALATPFYPDERDRNDVVNLSRVLRSGAMLLTRPRQL